MHFDNLFSKHLSLTNSHLTWRVELLSWNFMNFSTGPGRRDCLKFGNSLLGRGSEGHDILCGTGHKGPSVLPCLPWDQRERVHGVIAF